MSHYNYSDEDLSTRCPRCETPMIYNEDKVTLNCPECSYSNYVGIENKDYEDVERSPMGFQSEKAFKQLRDEGIVFSFRKKKGSYLGQVWINQGRGTEKEFNAMVRSKYKIIIEDEKNLESKLRNKKDKSGFESVEEWVDEIKKQNDGLPEKGYIFEVKKAEAKNG